MLNKLLLASVCLALSACMVYAPTYVSKNAPTVVHYESTSAVETSSTVKQETNEVSKRVEPKATLPRTKRSLAVCGAFTLPREVVPAYLTDELMATATDGQALDQILGRKVKELQTYIDSMHSRTEQAHLRWLESCEQKLLD